MGIFDAIGNSIKSGTQWLGQKAREVSQFIGDKVQKALTTIGVIAQGVSEVANKVSGYMPIVGGFVKALGDAGQWVADRVKDGSANNVLERAKTGLDDISNATKSFTKKRINFYVII